MASGEQSLNVSNAPQYTQMGASFHFSLWQTFSGEDALGPPQFAARPICPARPGRHYSADWSCEATRSGGANAVLVRGKLDSVERKSIRNGSSTGGNAVCAVSCGRDRLG